MMHTVQQLTDDTVSRCRHARTTGAISAAWSTGEQLLVALVLNDRAHLAALEYTPQQAHQRVYDGLSVPMTPEQYAAWVDDVRARV